MIRLTKAQLAKASVHTEAQAVPLRKKSPEQVKALKQLLRQTPQRRRESQRQVLERLSRRKR